MRHTTRIFNIDSRRSFSNSSVLQHGHLEPPKPGEEYDLGQFKIVGTQLNIRRLHITFIDKDGEESTFIVAKGDNLLDIAQANDIDMEGSKSPHYSRYDEG